METLPTERPAEQLNSRQLHFAQEYVKTINSKQAAINAGYSERTANA